MAFCKLAIRQSTQLIGGLLPAPIFAAVAMVVLLSACASKPSVQTSTRCPTLEAYSPEFQQGVAEEWDKLNWRVRKMLSDYRAVRVACRAVEN
jgi:type IV pilus biogenesis protein CpaD/CtpE